MTGWNKFLNEYGEELTRANILATQLTDEDFRWIKKEVVKAKKIGVKKNKTLAGHIKEEYAMPGINQSFNNFLLGNASTHEVFKMYNSRFNVNSENRPIYLDSFWVNYQKKYEFNPLHDHTGVYSFIIFVKIPYDLKKEENYFPEVATPYTEISLHPQGEQVQTSKLNFVNIDPNGQIVTKAVPADKSFEGKMFMFPSKQLHLVYPFYTSDDYRITVSGNIKVKV